MGILNEALRFEDLSADDRAAFRGTPAKELVKGGSTLFRFATDGENEVLGKWWVTRATYQLLAMRAERLGNSLEVLARSKLAVQRDFSTRMNRIYIGTLLSDVWTFQGPAKYQRLVKNDSKVILPGNFDQVWLGNLSAVHVRLAACDL